METREAIVIGAGPAGLAAAAMLKKRGVGVLVHASKYRNAEPYRGRDVLVVGSGNTGAEIAVDLAEGGAARVRLAVRTPPNIVRRQVNGVPNQVTGVLMRRLPPKVVDGM